MTRSTKNKLIDITKDRAYEIHKLIIWKSGGCMILGGTKPDVAPITPEEDEEIRTVWAGMCGSASYYDAVLKIYNGE